MHRSRPTFSLHSKAGFTIVELLVSAAVTIVLAGLLLTMTNGILAAWNRTSGTLSAQSQAQLVFDLLAEDLQSTIYRRDDGVWMDAGIVNENAVHLRDVRGWRVQNAGEPPFSETGRWGSRAGIRPTGVVQTEDFEASRFGRGGAWLRFFSTPAGSNTPQAVSYQIVRRPVTGAFPNAADDATNPAEVRYMLVRSDLPATTTFNRGYDLANYNSTFSEAVFDGTNWQNQNLPPQQLIRPGTGRAIANNVIDFGVRLYVNQGGGLDLFFPADASFRPNANNTYYRANGVQGRNSMTLTGVLANHYENGNDFEGQFPDVVDVFIRVLTDEGARLIQNLESGRVPPTGGNFDQAWDDIAREHSRVFTRRIFVNARPF